MRSKICVVIILLTSSIPAFASRDEEIKIPFIKYKQSTTLINNFQPQSAAQDATQMNRISPLGSVTVINSMGYRVSASASGLGEVGGAICKYVIERVIGDEAIKPASVDAIVSSAKQAFCTKDVSEVNLTVEADGNGSIGIVEGGVQAGIQITIECNKK